MNSNQKVWESNGYYDLAQRGSLDTDHPGMMKLFEYAKDARKILDFGCGEGTRLNLLEKSGKLLYGIDISKNAISKARKKYPKINFICGDIRDARLGDNFDLVFSAYVLEHTRNTEKILKELINRIKSKGILILMAPNYGAPNRASPVAKYNRIIKLFVGYLEDVYRIVKKRDDLAWQNVEPITNRAYEMDFDTKIEPYIGTLVDYLSLNNMKIIETDSVWERELENAKFHQRLFRFFGEKGVYPFKNWGPHILVIAEKL